MDDYRYSPSQSPEPGEDRSHTDREWIRAHSLLRQSNARINTLAEQDDWSADDEAYVARVVQRFAVKDMPSFYRNQAIDWLTQHPESCQQNDFLANVYQKILRGEEDLAPGELDALNRTIWRFMSDDERRVASANRRNAERNFGRMPTYQRRRRPRPRNDPAPEVAGFPFHVAEAYIRYHAHDVGRFAAHYGQPYIPQAPYPSQPGYW